MKNNLYLTLSLNKYLYGINTVYVEEVFNLPELTTISEVPHGIIGFVNPRENITSYRFKSKIGLFIPRLSLDR